MTPNSPKPTVKALIQYGSPKNMSSQAIIKALEITGNKAATTKCLENIIPTHAIKVASAPNKTSKDAVGENKLARKQPIVRPIVCFLLKKQSKTMISENLNWIGPYANGDMAIVKAAYVAAIMPFIQMSFTMLPCDFSIDL